MKPTTIRISEDPLSGIIDIRIEIEHKDGSSHSSTTIAVDGFTMMKRITRAIGRMLDDYQRDGTLETNTNGKENRAE